MEQSCAAGDSDCSQDLPHALALLASLRARSSKAIGWKALRTNDWSRALRIAEQLRDMEEDGDTVLMMGCSLIGLGRFQEAEAVLRRGPVVVTSASPYIPVELARAVLCQGRHDEAERIVVATLEQISAEATDRSVLTRHTDVLLEVFAARGNRDKDRIAIEKLRPLFPGDSLIRR